ncbi:MAG: site-2 protease family protein [Proteobacteria bacterium]|nr:site-2 protease family protein [Pseudomonadota bacterium]
MENLTLVQQITIMVIPLIFAITVHEVAHGWVANQFGDPTAKMMGRLTLNPIKHIDPIGTLLVPGILFYLGGFIFGWAKPVPITWQNLKNPRRDMALVALAGPTANLIMAILWGFIMKISLLLPPNLETLQMVLILMAKAGIMLNVVLMVLNLIPIPPLDGSRILSSLVSPRASNFLHQIEPYGFIILVILLTTGVLAKIMTPIIYLAIYWIKLLLNL